MTITNTICPQYELVVTIVNEISSNSDAIEACKWIGAHKDFKAHFSQVTDTRGITDNRVTTKGMYAQAEVNPFSNEARRVIIANTGLGKGLGKGLGNQYSYTNIPQQENYYLAKDFIDAFTWLDIGVQASDVSLYDPE